MAAKWRFVEGDKCGQTLASGGWLFFCPYLSKYQIPIAKWQTKRETRRTIWALFVCLTWLVVRVACQRSHGATD